MTSAARTSAQAAETPGDPVNLSEREKAEETLLILGRLGVAVHDSILASVGPDLTGNPEVFVICGLHLRGPLRPSDIVDSTGMTSGGVTKLLDRLEAGGYIRREFGVVKSDRRATRLVLTADGERLAEAYGDAVLSVMDTVTDALDELRAMSD